MEVKMCIRDRSEKLLFDPKTGRALNNNLLDYKLSTFMDHPRLRAYFVENPEPTSAFGTKSLGEPCLLYTSHHLCVRGRKLLMKN